MRIAVPLAYHSAEAGGGYTFEHDVADALVRNAGSSRHEFTVFTRCAVEPQARAENLRVVQLDKRAIWRWRIRGWQTTLANLAARRNRRRRWPSPRRQVWLEECLRAHGSEFVWNLAPVTPTFDLPYIAMVWDLQHRLQPFFPEVSGGSEWEAREQLFRVLLQRATFVITGNAAGQQEIEQFYQIPHERIRLLPHPTPRFALQACPGGLEALERWGLKPGYLFYPAQFWPHKNHTGLLHGVRLLRDQYGLAPSVVLVGSDKSNRQHVEQVAAELGLTDQLHILGFVDRQQLATLYRHAGSLVYVSFFGPENLPPLEAMALECPVIAARVSGAREQFGDAAVLVNPRDPGEMAAAMARVLREPELRTGLIERGRVRARQFTANEFVQGVFGLLDEFAAIRGCWGQRAA